MITINCSKEKLSIAIDGKKSLTINNSFLQEYRLLLFKKIDDSHLSVHQFSILFKDGLLLFRNATKITRTVTLLCILLHLNVNAPVTLDVLTLLLWPEFLPVS